MTLYAVYRGVRPRIAEALYKKAQASFAAKRLDEGIKYCDRAIMIYPRLGFLYYSRGVAYLQKGEMDKALADADKAVKFNVGWSAHMFRAGIYAEKGNQPKTLEDLSKTVELNPKYKDAYMQRGYIFLQQKKFNEAAADYTKVISLDINEAQAYRYRSYASLRLNGYEGAISDSSKFLVLEPGSSESYAIRGLAYRQKMLALNESQDSVDAQSGIDDLWEACDLGRKNACYALDIANDPGFNYASYTTVSLAPFLESYKGMLETMRTEVVKAVPVKEKDPVIQVIDAQVKKIVFWADYRGKIKPISKKKTALIQAEAKSSGQEQFASLYKDEINISSGGSEVWLPIQEKLLKALTSEFQSGDKTIFYAIAIGGVKNEPILLLTEFRTVKSDKIPFFKKEAQLDI